MSETPDQSDDLESLRQYCRAHRTALLKRKTTCVTALFSDQSAEKLVKKAIHDLIESGRVELAGKLLLEPMVSDDGDEAIRRLAEIEQWCEAQSSETTPQDEVRQAPRLLLQKLATATDDLARNLDALSLSYTMTEVDYREMQEEVPMALAQFRNLSSGELDRGSWGLILLWQHDGQHGFAVVAGSTLDQLEDLGRHGNRVLVVLAAHVGKVPDRGVNQHAVLDRLFPACV